LDAGEREVHAGLEPDEIQIDRLGADVGQLDELGVRIGRVVHQLADPQILGHRPNGKNRLGQPAPGAVLIARHQHARLDLRARSDRDRSVVRVDLATDLGALRRGDMARQKLDRDQEIGTVRGGIHAVNRQHVGPRPQQPCRQ